MSLLIGKERLSEQKVTRLLTDELSQRCKQNLGILLSVKDEAVEKIVEEAYDPKYGARPLRRKMESMIEDPLAEKILSMQIKRGDEIMISVEGDEIQIVQ